MDSLIIDEIIKNLKEADISGSDKSKFSDNAYTAFEIAEHNFHAFNTVSSQRKLSFIDGGNAEIIRAPNFSLQFIRVYAVIYERSKKIGSFKNEFYALITTVPKEEIYYTTKIFPLTASLIDDKKFLFNSFDKTLVSGLNRVAISRIADVLRRCAELQLATNTTEKLGKGDILVLDGDLQVKYTHEKEYLELLYTQAEKKEIAVTALSKTCSLLTEKGNSLPAVLSRKAQLVEWYYHPVAEITTANHKADMYFVKLHKNSAYVFKFESYKRNKHDINEIFTLLKEQAKDLIFLGYPYGLIEADKEARVSNNELGYIKTKFMAKLGKEWKSIEKYSNAMNAHDVLDSRG